MSPQSTYIDEWLDRAFRLAFFIHGERETAKKIVANAMNKLEIASNAQFKRYYYTPTGRAETSRATRNRVSLNDLQLLQRLVFVESENFEREKETTGKIGEKSLLTFFIKHLVRISLKRNSFYVTLGVSRILHNYATNDAMEIYNVVIQDPERVHDDYYYRSRKGVLMKELKARFGERLETVRVNRGEERFEHKNEAEDLIETAKDCLQFFTPWNSRCTIPEKFNPFEEVIKPFHFDKTDPDEEHRIEINRIHATLHPHCFDRLTAALRLPPSEQKMEIPQFMLSENIIENNDDFSNPPHLEADELQQIKDFLAAQAESRRAVSANLLRVVVDGSEQAKINLEETDKVSFDLGDEAELIEVRVVEKDGESVLATHLLSFDDLEKGIQKQSVVLEGGQKISFNLAPAKDKYGEVVGINCDVEYTAADQEKAFVLESAAKSFSFSNWFQNFNWAFKPALALGLILLLISIGWLFYRQSGKNGSEIVDKDMSIPVNPPSEIKLPEQTQNNTGKEEKKDNIVVPPPVKEQQKNLPATENRNRRNSADKKLVSPKKEIQTEAPKVLQANKMPPKTDQKNNDGKILRIPLRQSGNNFDNALQTTRNAVKLGKSLSEIKLIYLDITGDEDFSRQIREQISDELLKSKNLIVVQKEKAEARLIIYVRRESDEKQPENGVVTAVVRVVNAEGFVIYPNRKHITGWKYVGKALDLPKRIVRDLSSAKTAGEPHNK